MVFRAAGSVAFRADICITLRLLTCSVRSRVRTAVSRMAAARAVGGRVRLLTNGGLMLIEFRWAYRQIFCRASRHVKTTSGGIASPTFLQRFLCHETYSVGVSIGPPSP